MGKLRQKILGRSISYLLASLLILAGCSSSSSSKTGPVRSSTGERRIGPSGEIEEVHLFGIPVPMNFDRSRGPNGFIVRVFASSRAKAKGLPLRSGTLELVMFDGSITLDAVFAGTTALKVWSFPASRLQPHATSSGLGVGYQFSLLWEEAKPSSNRVTVLARYIGTSGNELYSAPSVMPLPSQ